MASRWCGRFPGRDRRRSGRLLLALRTWKSDETSPSVPAPVEGPYRLGPIDELSRDALVAELPSLIFAALFVAAGLYHLQLFRRQPDQREYLWFGLVAAGAGIYTLLRSQWKYALSDDFVQRVGTMVQPGDSALFALLRSVDPEIVAAQFKGYGGTILRTTLNADQRAKVEATLHAR